MILFSKINRLPELSLAEIQLYLASGLFRGIGQKTDTVGKLNKKRIKHKNQISLFHVLHEKLADILSEEKIT